VCHVHVACWLKEGVPPPQTDLDARFAPLSPCLPACLPASVSFAMLYTCEEPRRGGTEEALREQFQASHAQLARLHV
jgi:hypothetical protein